MQLTPTLEKICQLLTGKCANASDPMLLKMLRMTCVLLKWSKGDRQSIQF